MAAEPAVKSQPVYKPLAWDLSGTSHVLAGHGAGMARLQEFRKSIQSTDVHLVHGATAEAALASLRQVLQASTMSTRLYLAGDEAFLWKAVRVAREFDMALDQWQAELWGSLKRRVYCVHCKATTEGVSSSVCVCAGCGRKLSVRDHFSRPLAAYFGVAADAEAPGELPTPEELYP